MSELVETYDVKEFEIKQFLGRCISRAHQATLYASSYNKRSNDNWLSFQFGGDGETHDFRGFVLPYRVTNLISELDLRIDGIVQREYFRTRNDLIARGQWCGCERDRPGAPKHALALVVPVSVRGWRHIDIRIRFCGVEQHTDIVLHTLLEPIPPPAKKEWWLNWWRPFLYGMTASMVLVKVLAEIL